MNDREDCRFTQLSHEILVALRRITRATDLHLLETGPPPLREMFTNLSSKGNVVEEELRKKMPDPPSQDSNRRQAEARTIAELNGLLLTEMSAVQAYRLAQSQTQEDGMRPMLDLIENTHVQAAVTLRRQVESCGGKPVTEVGPLRRLVTRLVSWLPPLGRFTGVKALARTEQRTFRKYSKTASSTGLPGESRRVICGRLLPQQGRNLALIRNSLMLTGAT